MFSHSFQVPVDHVDHIVLEKALSVPVAAVASPSAVRYIVDSFLCTSRLS